MGAGHTTETFGRVKDLNPRCFYEIAISQRDTVRVRITSLGLVTEGQLGATLAARIGMFGLDK